MFPSLTSARAASGVAAEDQCLTAIEALVGELEMIRLLLDERIIKKPFDQDMQPALLLENIENVVVPPVFSDQAVPLRRARRRLWGRCFLISLAVDGDPRAVHVDPWP